MELHYEPKTDIMRVDWPDLAHAHYLELERTFDQIREAVQSYFIKRFLIDSRKTTYQPDPEQLRQVSTLFLKALEGTRVRKVARLQSVIPKREAVISEISQQVTQAIPSHLVFKTFTNETEAITWLLEPDPIH